MGTYQRKWAGISGYVETTPLKQAFQEINEETGLTSADIELVKKGEPLEVIDDTIGKKWVVHPYLFHVKRVQKIQIDWEHIEMKWIYPEEITHYSTVPRLEEALESVKSV